MDTQTRHALKQDKLIKTAQVSVNWLDEHRARAIQLGIAGAILLAALIVCLVIYFQRSAAAKLAFGQAMDVYSASLAQPGQPATPGEQTFATAAQRAKAANQQFTAIANRYGWLRTGRNARYFAGLTAMDMNQDKVAESDLKSVAGSSDKDLASLAKVALASLYAQTNRVPQAVALYQELIAKPTTTVPADASQLRLAALYEATNPAEAKRIYAKLKDAKTAASQIAAEKLGQH